MESDIPMLIDCIDYSFRYHRNAQALRQVNFFVRPGEHTAVLGLNGSGKSTLLRSLVGLIRGEGTVRVLGMEVKKPNLREIRQRVGLVFQDPQIQLFCPTVIEDVAFGPINLHGDANQAREEAAAALEAVGYTGGLFTACADLSLGEMRKVALAGVLVLQPDLLLLDEPDSFLDWDGKRRLIELLQSLEQITRILVTHDMEFASALCEQCLYLKQGTVLFHGSIAAFHRRIFS